MPLTEAHVFVLTHHDIKAVPSWVSGSHTGTFQILIPNYITQPPAPAPVFFIIRNFAYWKHRRYGFLHWPLHAALNSSMPTAAGNSRPSHDMGLPRRTRCDGCTEIDSLKASLSSRIEHLTYFRQLVLLLFIIQPSADPDPLILIVLFWF